MNKPSFAAVLFSLFAPLERALEIEGDLIEQAPAHGPFWYPIHVALVALALYGRAFSRAPVSTSFIGIGVFLAIFACVVVAEMVATSPLALGLSSDYGVAGAPYRIAILSVVAAPASYLLGFLLVRCAPTLGFGAALAGIVLFIAALTILQLSIYPPEVAPNNVLKVIFTAVPLLLGGGLAYRGRFRRLTT